MVDKPTQLCFKLSISVRSSNSARLLPKVRRKDHGIMPCLDIFFLSYYVDGFTFVFIIDRILIKHAYHTNNLSGQP